MEVGEMEKPAWFDDVDARDVIHVLRSITVSLNRLDADNRQKPLQKKLTAAKYPDLFDFSSSDKRHFLLSILKDLAVKKIISIVDNSHGQILTITFNCMHENTLRTWLNMPRISAEQVAWQMAVKNSCSALIKGQEHKFIAMQYPGVYPVEDLLIAFARLCAQIPLDLQKNIKYTWRQLSAFFFFGDSKYLDANFRREALLVLLPDLGGMIKERPLQISVALGRCPKAILFVENWDTHCWLSGLPEMCESFHLVYAAGYKASAKNIRRPNCVKFFFQGDTSQQEHFTDLWFSEGDIDLSIYFWGDLDYEGINILNSLQAQFPSLSAWKIGYSPMLAAIYSGVGHKPESAGKENQRDLGFINCEYARNVLVPALRETGLMLDQEWLVELPDLKVFE